MKLSKESRYAIEGLMVLAKKRFGTPMQLLDIAAMAGAPPSFLAKIFQKLNRANIVTSSRGAVRGYALARRPDAVTVKYIFAAVEGGDVFDRCIFWSDRCTDLSPCPMHFDSQQCVACHGISGRGDGEAAYLLYPKPRDFVAARYRLVSTWERVPTDQDLFDTISRGMPGSNRSRTTGPVRTKTSR